MFRSGVAAKRMFGPDLPNVSTCFATICKVVPGHVTQHMHRLSCAERERLADHGERMTLVRQARSRRHA